MPDYNMQISADRKYIAMDETYEVMYWTKVLNVSRKVLEGAVRAVGTSAQKVREYLGK